MQWHAGSAGAFHQDTGGGAGRSWAGRASMIHPSVACECSGCAAAAAAAGMPPVGQVDAIDPSVLDRDGGMETWDMDMGHGEEERSGLGSAGPALAAVRKGKGEGKGFVVDMGLGRDRDGGQPWQGDRQTGKVESIRREGWAGCSHDATLCGAFRGGWQGHGQICAPSLLLPSLPSPVNPPRSSTLPPRSTLAMAMFVHVSRRSQESETRGLPNLGIRRRGPARRQGGQRAPLRDP